MQQPTCQRTIGVVGAPTTRRAPMTTHVWRSHAHMGFDMGGGRWTRPLSALGRSVFGRAVGGGAEWVYET